MVQKNTKKQYKNTDPALSTEKTSQGLKNLSKGQACELLVAHYLEGKGWKIIYRNKQFFGVEIDLIAKNRNSYILVEIKSLHNDSYLEKIISLKQKKRLKKVAAMLSNEFPGSLNLLLATVSRKKEIRFFQLVT